MAMWIRPAKKIRKVKSKNGKEVLHRLEEFLKSDNVVEEPVRILCGFWKDQQKAISYQELRQAVQTGDINYATLQLWQQDYSTLVANQFEKVWMNAIKAGSKGQPILDGIYTGFVETSGILNWINERGAAFITECTQEQKKAIATFLTKKMMDSHTVDELAKMIRPCIGLTEAQVKANTKYYDSIVANLRKNHPRMREESIRKKALDAAQKFSERQHRARALMIAQTESAYAYNKGADESIRQAQYQNLLGTVKKRWSTSGDDAVCAICTSLEGIEIDLDDEFKFKGKLLFPGQHMLPPAHPRCACAVEYIETEPVVAISQIKILITQEDSLKEYTVQEIEDIANQTEKIVSKHIDIPSKWSGNVIVDNESKVYGKLWNCDIITCNETSPHIILHEQLHARSISYYDEDVFLQYQNIEEATVQLMAQEISKIENIKIIASAYDDLVESLRRIGKRISGYVSDYNFAKELMEIGVPDRLPWLSEKLYDTMRADVNATVSEYMEYSELLNILY